MAKTIFRKNIPAGVVLTDERKAFLLSGWWFDKGVEKRLFRDEGEMKNCWEANNKTLMGHCDIPMSKRDGFELSYEHLRPWGYYRFDLDLEEIGYKGSCKFFENIEAEFQYLKDHGLTIPSDEKRIKEYFEIKNFKPQSLNGKEEKPMEIRSEKNINEMIKELMEENLSDEMIQKRLVDEYGKITVDGKEYHDQTRADNAVRYYKAQIRR